MTKKIIENMQSRMVNWKFKQARKYWGALTSPDSKYCLLLLSKLWGDSGWDRGGIFGPIIEVLVDYIITKEKWELIGELEGYEFVYLKFRCSDIEKEWDWDNKSILKKIKKEKKNDTKRR